MGVDGFSMASIGMPKDITSAQAAATTEQQVVNADEKVVNRIDRALNKRINNDEEKEHKNQYFDDGFQEDDEEDEDENENSEESENSEELPAETDENNQNVKKYKPYEIKDPENVIVRYNNVNDKVELYNKATKKAVETIRPKDFVEMITKLDYNSGILVNKKI